MNFTLGCKFTLANFLVGALGGLVALLVLPGSYTTLPRLFRNKRRELQMNWNALARLIVSGIGGCVVDCNSRNTFFGGFFSWHVFTWLSEDGWSILRGRLLDLVKYLCGKRG